MIIWCSQVEELSCI